MFSNERCSMLRFLLIREVGKADLSISHKRTLTALPIDQSALSALLVPRIIPVCPQCRPCAAERASL